MPVKGITYDYRTEAAHLGKHLVFEDTKLLLTQIEEGLWRVSAYGDIAGLGEEFDQRRVRNLISLACKTFDNKEALTKENLRTYFRTCSPDDLPLLGALKHNPNIFINSGHGGRNAAISIASSKLISEIMQTGDITLDIPKESISPARF